jgi:hypothetical protein
MRLRSLLRGPLALLMVTGCALSAPLTITFGSSLLPATRGQTVTFSATVANTTSASLLLNADSLNIAAPLTANDTKFLLNFPLSLATGQVFTAPAFDVSVPSTTPYGLYAGVFDILGGGSVNAQTTIGTATFAVSVVPEPGTFGSGLAGLGCLMVLLEARASRSNRPTTGT